MIHVLRNISNVRSQESLVIVQPNGVIIEKDCSPIREPKSQLYTIWKSLKEWINNLVEQGHLSSIVEFKIVPSHVVINMLDGSVIHMI